MKSKYMAFFLSLGLPLLLTSCKLSNLNPENIHPEGPPFNAQNELVTTVNNYLAIQQKRYNCLADGKVYEVKDYLTLDGECRPEVPNPKGSEQAENVRNETIERALFVIDANYVEWVNYLYLGRATGNFVADTVQLTTSGVIGALNGPADTLRILGVALNTFQGARSSFDLNYFDKQNTTIIVNQMDSNRSKAYKVILNKKGKDITKYSMAEAIKDMVAYYNAGTFVSAFTALSRQTAIDAKTSANAVDKINSPPNPSPTSGTPDSIGEAQSPQTDPSVVSSEKKVLEILDKLESLLNDFNQSQLAISKLQKVFAELQTDQNFQPMIKENNLSWPSDWKQPVVFLRNVREKASSKPKYSQLLLKIDQTIINFGQ
jgi:hypothetical protein